MSDNHDWRRDEDDEADQEVDEADYKTQKDAVILAIEVSEAMLETPPPLGSRKADRDSPLQAALKCAYHLMEQRIISNPKDMMGILLFGTAKSKFYKDSHGRVDTAFPNCYLLTDLDVPAAEDVKALKDLAEHCEDAEGVLEPSAQSACMSNVLFCANQIFTTRAANFGSRRLFIVTINDDPHPSDKAAISAAAVRAKDLYDLGVAIDLFPIAKSDSKFDASKFYNDLVYGDSSDSTYTPAIQISQAGEGLTLLNSLISNINSRKTAKRALFSNLGFEIAPGLRISVKGYNVLHRQTPARTCYVWLDGEKPQIAIGETSRSTEDSSRKVEDKEVQKAYKFGGEYIYLKPEEQKAIRNFGSPIIRMIGFKPRKSLPMWARVKKSTFIMPSEEDYVGSSRVFTALWQKLLRDDKMGIAWCLVRANAQPILAAVIPSKAAAQGEAELDQLPSGLWLYPLPFADDVREVRPPQGQSQSSDELKTHMRVVVQQLQLPKATYIPAKYPNPALQWHYRILQAMALEDEVPSRAEDATEPKFKAISKRAGGYLEEWTERLQEEAGLISSSKGLKREVDEGESSERPAKQRRTAAVNKGSASLLTLPDIKAAAAKGGIQKMTVAELKDLAGAKGLSTSGRKQDLVDRVVRWAEKNGA
ncbi:hypothetical protein CDD81_4237 [Ophiocordyceps australis]|uniref:ATP-dependent DNA helicase II subunit 1 n=1 Tax=Ophiocordyceps australis TaxID=1399860 RepID=A0A2C5YA90_9HYPO|nr:hypothetical protein CDD81_4237 [Ophiocordyceps australis]